MRSVLQFPELVVELESFLTQEKKFPSYFMFVCPNSDNRSLVQRQKSIL